MFKTLVFAIIVSAAFCLLTGCRTAINLPATVVETPVSQSVNETPGHAVSEIEEAPIANAIKDARESLTDRRSRHINIDSVNVLIGGEDGNECDLDTLEVNDDPGAWTTHCRAVKAVEK